MELDSEVRGDDAPSTTSKKLNDVDGLERFSRAVTINREPAELYEFWRNFSNLPEIMDNLVSVTLLDNHRSEWTAKGPAGADVTWIAYVTEDIEGALIAWRSEDDADVFNEGRTRQH